MYRVSHGYLHSTLRSINLKCTHLIFFTFELFRTIIAGIRLIKLIIDRNTCDESIDKKNVCRINDSKFIRFYERISLIHEYK